jgi:hypothetical protein
MPANHRPRFLARSISIPAQHQHKEHPMWSTHPFIAEQLIRDRQDRLRQISQHTHLRREARRIRRRQHIKT